VFLAWLFSTWFLLTHHIDRFWIPMIPVVALLAGGGAAIFERRVASSIAGAVVAALVAFNLTICATVSGYNAGTTELTYAEQLAAKRHTPDIRLESMIATCTRRSLNRSRSCAWAKRRRFTPDSGSLQLRF
jgi:hypothetical protein